MLVIEVINTDTKMCLPSYTKEFPDIKRSEKYLTSLPERLISKQSNIDNLEIHRTESYEFPIKLIPTGELNV